MSRFLATSLAVAAVAALGACTDLPSLEGRTISTAFEDTEDTALGRAIGPRAAAHPGTSGVHALADSRNAFAARMLLAAAAERSLDVQYYIWREDLTGTLLFESLHQAADRGVRVRLLLDDNNTSGLDPTLAALDAHPNIEVRLFNPFVVRSFRLHGFLTDFSRANRRMHNKSFTADNQATIIGGRNVGDEYFGATDGVLFADLDVLAIGPIVNEVSKDFDRYWSSGSSYPVDRLLPPADASQLEALAAKSSVIERDPVAQRYIEAVRNSSFAKALLERSLPFEWAPVRMVSDDPAKGLGEAAPEALLTFQLERILDAPDRNVELVSPYFVPAKEGVVSFSAMAGRGVRVRVLTNSLEATDVAAVHAGYAKRRKALLEAGVELFELRHLAAGRDREGTSGPLGSSGSSLHAKTFAVDGERVFIGSFNFDPRSANLNTELGFVIESASLAGQIEQTFDQRVLLNAYQVRLGEDGELYWIEQGEGRVVHEIEPGTSFWQRAFVRFLAMLPIDWLL